MPLLLLLAAVVGDLNAQVTRSSSEAASAVPGAVTISGTIVAQGTGRPIPFSTVRLQPIGRERFTNQEGAFVYYAVVPGKYQLHVRQVGYLPEDTTFIVSANAPLNLVVTMNRIAAALDEVKVTAPPRLCLVPDDFGAVTDSELSTVLEEAKKNAAREQLLRHTYPFEYKIAQTHDTYDIEAKLHALQYDTSEFRSDDSWRYKRGKVVSNDRSKLFGDVRLMRLPTLADLADRSFLTNHCFKYAGVVGRDGLRTHRIDFLPDSLLIAPDVEGSIFMDSATYKIRRAEFRLTRGGTVKPAILGMEVTTTYREILPNVSLFDEIRSTQPLGVIKEGGNRVESRESQRLLSFRFLLGGPPGIIGHKWIGVGSVVADSLAGVNSLKPGPMQPGPRQKPEEPSGPSPSQFPYSLPLSSSNRKHMM
ncbi:MAG: carboxypeptidase regulatory-like domain-containing protein [Gemmatimonadaceae bacterium]